MTTLLLCLENDDLSLEQRAEIQALVHDMDVVLTRDEDEMARHYENVEIAAGWLEPEMVLQMPRLRWAQHWAAGVDSFTSRRAVVEKDFVLTNGSGIHAEPITEHILALLFAFARGLHCAVRAQVDHRWGAPEDPCRDDIFEFPGKTMLLIGVGAIGERTAVVSSALGMRVVGVRRHPSEEVPGVDAMVGPDQLLEVLPQADFVVLTVPLTDTTHHMIGEEELRALKPSAIIVNIGRGGTIDEEALIPALREGRIGGAGLDVFETEPLPADSPLWEMENVIVTSHYAGHNPYYDERALAIFVDNLRRYIAGAPLRNVVDMEAGY